MHAGSARLVAERSDILTAVKGPNTDRTISVHKRAVSASAITVKLEHQMNRVGRNDDQSQSVLWRRRESLGSEGN